MTSQKENEADLANNMEKTSKKREARQPAYSADSL